MDKIKFINIVIELLKEGKTTEIIAHGISMFPILLPGDLLKISPINMIQKGDIVVFKGTTTLVAHRIINIKNGLVTCKGDSLITSDPIHDKKEILGVIIGRTRNKKYRSVNHWTFKLMRKIMPILGKYPRILIRYSALVYLTLTNFTLEK